MSVKNKKTKYVGDGVQATFKIPRKKPNQNKTAMVLIRMTEAEKNKLRKQAKSCNRTLSEYTRLILLQPHIPINP